MIRELFFFFIFIVTIVHVKPRLDFNKFKPEVQNLAKILHNSCMSKTKTDENLIQKAKKGIFENEDQIKLYLTCTWEESSVITDGKLNADVITDIFPPEYKDIVPKIIIPCFDKFPTEKTIEDRIMKMEKCRFKADPNSFAVV